MSRKRAVLRTIERQYDQLIGFAEQHYGDHEGIRRAEIVRWLAQFRSDLREVAAKSLRELTYHSTASIRKMTRELADRVYQEYHEMPRKKVYFVPIGGAGSGAQIIARILRSMRDVPNRCIITMTEVETIDPDAMSVVVLVEDFSGTGKQIDDWWDVVEGMFLPKNADILLGLLVMNHRARTKLKPVFRNIVAVSNLGREYDVFDKKCRRFTPREKKKMLTACVRTGCPKQYIRGFGDCGLLVAFKHGCPNNSLPILWFERGNKWRNLFHRQSI